MRLGSLSVFFLLLSFIAPPQVAAEIDPVFYAREQQPRIPWSGRVNDVAIDPSDPQHILATTESGGLWRSRDGGVAWSPVAGLPAFNLNAVRFLSADPRVIIATANTDFQRRRIDTGPATTSGGGVWVSRDGGGTWRQPTRAMPFVGAIFRVDDTSCPPRHEAWAITEDPESGRVFVATSCGISFTDELARSEDAAWTHVYLSRATHTPELRRLTAIAALDGPGVIAAGGDGAWHSIDNGVSWRRADTPVGFVADLHGASAVRGVSGAGYLISIGAGGDRRLWRTISGGRNWIEVAGDPSNRPDCGGIAHVYAFRTRTATFEEATGVFYGNTCLTYRRIFARNILEGLLGGGAFAERWDVLPGSHLDTRAVGLRPLTLVETAILAPPQPLFLASDGGLDRRTSEGWTPIGSGLNGINALQLYDVEGQFDDETGGYRLAIGTQDNSLWSSANGVDWPASQAIGNEGGGVTMAKHAEGGDKWTAAPVSGLVLTDPLFQNWELWPGLTARTRGWGQSPPVRAHPSALDDIHVQFVWPNAPCPNSDPDVGIILTAAECAPSGSRAGFEMSGDYGRSPFRIATPDFPTYGPPKIVGGVLYQAIGRGDYRTRIYEGERRYIEFELMRVPGVLSGRAHTHPAMNGFGGFGAYGSQFDWRPIFGAHPDGLGLIAPDVINNKMMASADGGESWNEIIGLTDQITGGGRHEFSVPGANGDWNFSNVTVIKHFHENPDMIAIGTQSAGAFVSVDGGRRWSFAAGSAAAPNILDFDWKSANEIYFASYGRGLWKIDAIAPLDFSALRGLARGERSDEPGLRNLEIGDLRFIAADSFDNQVVVGSTLADALKDRKFDHVTIAVGGEVSALKAAAAGDDQIVVSPGASVYSFSENPGQKRAASKPRSLALDPSYAKKLADELGLKPAAARNDAAAIYAAFGADNRQDHSKTPPRSRFEGSKTPPESARVVGVAYSNDKLAGYLVGYGAQHKRPASDTPKFRPRKPIKVASFKGPQLDISQSGATDPGSPAFLAGRPIVIKGRGFRPKSLVTLEIDGTAVGKAVVDDSGAFSAAVSTIGLSRGPHRLTARAADQTETTATADRFIQIRHLDEEHDPAPEKPKQNK